MSVVSQVISLEPKGGLNFGNYKSAEKLKSDDFDVNGDIYKVKTHSEITRIEKNSMLLYESVPGTAVSRFTLNEKECAFSIEGFENTQITMELEPEKEYRIFIDDVNVGTTKSNRSSKLNFSVELSESPKDIRIEKI